MRRFFTAAALLYSFNAFAVEAPVSFYEECEARLPATKIEVRTSASPLSYDFTKSVRHLTQRHASGKGQYTLGLTERSIASEMEVKSSMLKHKGSSLVCMRPHVIVTLTLDPHIVYVGREFPEKTCSFNSILQHEQRHVTVNNMALQRTAASMNQALHTSFGNRIFYGDEAEMGAEVRAHIQDWIKWAESEMRKVDQLHKQIDTKEEYAKNLTVCNGEIPTLMKRAGIR